MSALRKYKATSKGGGLIEVEALNVPAGEELEIVVIEDDNEEQLALLTSALSQSAFSRIWDDPEEDAAWKDL